MVGCSLGLIGIVIRFFFVLLLFLIVSLVVEAGFDKMIWISFIAEDELQLQNSISECWRQNWDFGEIYIFLKPRKLNWILSFLGLLNDC